MRVTSNQNHQTMKRVLLTLTFVLFIAPIAKAQDFPSHIPTEGLVAYYPFNGNANDESGNGHHGTVNGATLTTDRDGNENSAYYFNVNASGGWGSAQNRITISSPTISNENSFTISAWINLETKPIPFDNRPHTIMGRWDGNGVAVFRHQINYSGEISTNLRAGTNSNIVEGGSVTYGEWYHIVITYNGSILKQYINNQLTKQEQLDIDINTSSTDLTFGELHMANGHWYLFSGKMDDLGYWNRALTEQEIQNLFTSSSGDILLNGTVSAEDHQIKNVADPTDAQDAVTKNYTDTKFYSQNEVDALIANLQHQINEMNQTITSGELEGNWNVKELYYLNPDTNEITSTFPTPECSKPYQYYEFLQNNGLSKTGIGTNWASQQCTSSPYPETQVQYTISIVEDYTYISWPRDEVSNNEWQVLERVNADTIIVRYWRDGEISLYNNEVYGLKLVKEARIE